MDYQGNSNKAKAKKAPAEKAKVEKVVTGEVVEKKKTLGQKFKAVFFGGEFKGAAQYITADVLLPAARNLLVDMTTKGIERMVYGESAMTRPRRPEYRSRVSYHNAGRTPIGPGPGRVSLPDQPPHPYKQNRREANDLVLSSREEAELVLERLIDIVDKYEVASLADLYDLVGLPTSHVDNTWGWSYLTTAEVRQVRDGYLLDLPTMEPI